ncbi:MAG: ATP-binding protein [Elainellaceae cyanobacterium]
MVSILLLENNSTDIAKIRASLEADGIDHTLESVAAYADFLRALRYQTPDLILISDRLISVEENLILKQVHSRCPAVPIVLMASAPNIREAVSAIRQGASDYICKAQIDEQLLNVVRALSDRRFELTANTAEVREERTSDPKQISEELEPPASPERKRSGRSPYRAVWTETEPEHPALGKISSYESSSARVINSEISSPEISGREISGDETPQYSTLRSRLSRQAVIVNLTRQALAGMEVNLLFKHAVNQIAQALNAEYCEVFELVSYRTGFVLRAAKGWPEDAVNQTTASVNSDSQSGLTLLSDKPVVVEDISCDDRLTPSSLVYPTAVSSLVSVLICGSARQPFGLVSAASAQAHRFTQEDAMFLQAIANTLAIAAERKQSERSLRAHANELAGITAVLAKTNGELAERNRELNEFAYVASHDLRAPLRAIANLSEWIEEELREHMGPKTAYEMSLLRKRVHRIESLLNGLLQYSRVGRLQIDPELVSTATVLKEVSDLLNPPLNFTIVIGDHMPVFHARRLLLQQTFSNLISNAIKHHQGVRGCVEITVRDVGEFYEFIITDDGPGIAPEHHERIFTIFQVLEPRDKTENTGVGLSIAKKIVESEGGKITIESQLGRGATFRFTWPKRS